MLSILLLLVTASVDVSAYIETEWDKTVRTCKKEENSLIPLPYMYTVPSSGGVFQEMYYWDTYFTNIGLLLSNRKKLAECNVRNISALIERYGFMPNGNRTYYLNRSQPPFFSRMVRDVYSANEDLEFLSEMYKSVSKEYRFWIAKRMTPTGLLRYVGKFKSEKERQDFGRDFVKRVGLPATDDHDLLGKHGDRYLSYAECGWDCTSRFNGMPQNGNWVDLNSLCYAMAVDLAFFAKKLKNGDEFHWVQEVQLRRKLMNDVLWDESLGMFCDYDFIEKRKNDLVTAATFYPLFVKVATSNQASRIVTLLPKIECQYGIAGSENRKLFDYQWDYPNGWACLQYIVAQGLLNYGYREKAIRIARKYVLVVDRLFDETGQLWEKYDVTSGKISQSKEYSSQPMMGWSAGVYLWCKRLLATQ